MKLTILILAASLAFGASKVQIKSLACTPTLTAGESGICTITLTTKAPKGGTAFTITVKPSGAPLTVPTVNVIVPQGKISASFQIAQQ